MKNKVCVVTGANSGVGFEACRGFAKLGARIVLVCRDRARGEEAVKRLAREVPSTDLTLEIAELASLTQVRDLANRISRAHPEVDLLLNNAGVYRAEREVTEDGHETTLAVNHLSHFLLTPLLLPNLCLL